MYFFRCIFHSLNTSRSFLLTLHNLSADVNQGVVKETIITLCYAALNVHLCICVRVRVRVRLSVRFCC